MAKGQLAIWHFLLHLQLKTALSYRWHRASTKLWENKLNEAAGVISSMLPAPSLLGRHR